MLIKKEISDYFLIKGKFHLPDLIGLKALHELGPGAKIACVLHDLEGNEYEVNAKVAFELINYKARSEHLEDIGGSIVIENPPKQNSFTGWKVFVSTIY